MSLLLARLGALHLAVDAASGTVLDGRLPGVDPGLVVALFLLYDALAFALQPLVGLVADRVRRPGLVAAAGCALVAAGLVVEAPWAAVALAATGNAVFHVGAGILALVATPGRAAGPGLFIGPGALGVVLGQRLGGLDAPPFAWMAAAMAFAAVASPWHARPEPPAAVPAGPPVARLPGAAAALLLFAVAVRAATGFVAVLPVAGLPGAAWALAGAACAGKMAGGAVADRLGWRGIAMATLASAALLLGVGGGDLLTVAAAVLLFQAVTGVTLAALCRAWPGRPGLAFGLSCLALFAGSLPSILQVDAPLAEVPGLVPGLTLAAGAAIVAALSLRPD